MQHYAAFHLWLHCLQKYLFSGFPNTKGQPSCLTGCISVTMYIIGENVEEENVQEEIISTASKSQSSKSSITSNPHVYCAVITLSWLEAPLL